MVRRSACCAPCVMLRAAHTNRHRETCHRATTTLRCAPNRHTRALLQSVVVPLTWLLRPFTLLQLPLLASVGIAGSCWGCWSFACHASPLHRFVRPVCLIQDDNLVSPRWQSDLLLRKHLDLVAHHINASARVITHNPHMQHATAAAWRHLVVSICSHCMHAGTGPAAAGGASQTEAPGCLQGRVCRHSTARVS